MSGFKSAAGAVVAAAVVVMAGAVEAVGQSDQPVVVKAGDSVILQAPKGTGDSVRVQAPKQQSCY